MAGRMVSENTMPASTPTAVKMPKPWIGGMDDTASEPIPPAVVSEVMTTGGVICSIVSRTVSRAERSGCSDTPSRKW